MGEDGDVKRVLKWMLGVTLLFSLLGGGWWMWRADQWGMFRIFHTKEDRPEPDSERYDFLVAELAGWREELAGQYLKARTNEEKEEIEQDARVILELMMPEMMRCWLGTGYDFNGVAEKPGKGKIACGYFVSTVIRDAGFKVNRYKLAQQPSQNILRTFVGSEYCQLKVDQNYQKYVNVLESKAHGIYLVGLDTHVGFIMNGRDGMRFLHSSGIEQAGVVEESRDGALALKWSRWRMLGHFTGDPAVIRMWLSGEAIPVRE